MTPLCTNRYVGTPYTQNGCYKLLYDVYHNELGIDLDADGLFVVEGGWGSAVSDGKADWVQVDSPMPFDAVLMFGSKSSEVPTHIGVYAGGGVVLHTRRKTGALLERLDVLQRAGVVEGFYRYRGLCQC